MSLPPRSKFAANAAAAIKDFKDKKLNSNTSDVADVQEEAVEDSSSHLHASETEELLAHLTERLNADFNSKIFQTESGKNLLKEYLDVRFDKVALNEWLGDKNAVESSASTDDPPLDADKNVSSNLSLPKLKMIAKALSMEADALKGLEEDPAFSAEQLTRKIIDFVAEHTGECLKTIPEDREELERLSLEIEASKELLDLDGSLIIASRPKRRAAVNASAGIKAELEKELEQLSKKSKTEADDEANKTIQNNTVETDDKKMEKDAEGEEEEEESSDDAFSNTNTSDEDSSDKEEDEEEDGDDNGIST